MAAWSSQKNAKQAAIRQIIYSCHGLSTVGEWLLRSDFGGVTWKTTNASRSRLAFESAQINRTRLNTAGSTMMVSLDNFSKTYGAQRINTNNSVIYKSALFTVIAFEEPYDLSICTKFTYFPDGDVVPCMPEDPVWTYGTICNDIATQMSQLVSEFKDPSDIKGEFFANSLYASFNVNTVPIKVKPNPFIDDHKKLIRYSKRGGLKNFYPHAVTYLPFHVY